MFWALDKGDATIFERSPLEKIASQNRLVAFRLLGFWKCMDMLRDRTQLQTMRDEGRIAWRM